MKIVMVQVRKGEILTKIYIYNSLQESTMYVKFR